jgi:uncharacterized tellurite resistance protein B-like protein
MTLWTRFTEIIDQVAGGKTSARDLHEEQLRLASAALLVNAASIDGNFDADERRSLKALLRTRYGLSDADVRKLVSEAQVEEQEAVDLYRFTSVLCRELDQDGRKRIIEMLWEVVLADGVIHEFESNLVSRVAELLGVSARDRVILRKAAEARVPGASSDDDEI